MKNIEIERKFLLSPPYSIEEFLKDRGINCKKESIEQFYLSSNEAGVNRYRRVANRYIHTIKKGSGLQRQEIEEEITLQEYQEAKKRASNIIKKIRCHFEIDNYHFELDIFKESLNGLIILEIEFNDLESAKSFKIPNILSSIVSAEVTEDIRFTNGYLSKTMTIPKVEE